jgi:hypothetical protein
LRSFDGGFASLGMTGFFKNHRPVEGGEDNLGATRNVFGLRTRLAIVVIPAPRGQNSFRVTCGLFSDNLYS